MDERQKELLKQLKADIENLVSEILFQERREILDEALHQKTFCNKSSGGAVAFDDMAQFIRKRMKGSPIDH